MKLLLSQPLGLRMRAVLALFLTLPVSSCAILGYRDGVRETDESYLKMELASLRNALKEYSSQKGRPPKTLRQLVDEGFLPLIRRDPITGERDWIIVPYDCSNSTNCKEGIRDIHSASTAKSSKGNPYTEW